MRISGFFNEDGGNDGNRGYHVLCFNCHVFGDVLRIDLVLGAAWWTNSSKGGIM